MNTSSGVEPRPSAALVSLLLLIGAYLVVGYITLTPGHDWGDDWAQYVNHARNLALGHAYADTGYVFNPLQPHIGPPAYSPGLPLLLAPLIGVLGLNILAMKCLSLVCLALAMLLTYLLFRDSLGAWVAVAGAAFSMGHDLVWAMHNIVLSEPSYLVWSLAALYCGTRACNGRGLGAAIACGVFSYAAFATRPIGAAMIVAVALYEILQRRLVSWRFLCVVGIPVLGIILQKHFLALADYSNELRTLTPQVVLDNFLAYWQQAGTVFPLGPLSNVTPLVVAALTAVGIGYRVRDRMPDAPADDTAMRLVAVLRAIPLDVWYLLVYGAVLVVLPFVIEARYLFPTMPIVCAYVAFAVTRVLAPARQARTVMALVLVATVLYYGALHAKHDAANADRNALCDDCRALYSFLQTETPTGATVAFVKPRAMALLSGRKGWMWANGLSRQASRQEMSDAHVDYIVLVPPDSFLADRYPAYLSWDGWQADPDLRLVYQNRSFRVLGLHRKI